MELDMYKIRLQRIRAKVKRLKEEEKALHEAFAMSHPWNAHIGHKVRINNNGEWSERGYLIRVEPSDDVVGCVVLNKVKNDGSRGRNEFRVYFAHDRAQIEVEE